MKKILLFFTICAVILSCEKEVNYWQPRTATGPIFITTTSEQHDFINYATATSEQYEGSWANKNGFFLYNNCCCIIMDRVFEMSVGGSLHLNMLISSSTTHFETGKRYNFSDYIIFNNNADIWRAHPISSNFTYDNPETGEYLFALNSNNTDGWVEFTKYSQEKISGRFYLSFENKDGNILNIYGHFTDYELLFFDCTTDEKY